MSRIQPLLLTDLPIDIKNILAAGADIMGFTPNDGLIMARKPNMLSGLLALVQAIYAPGAVSSEIKKLVGLMTSNASGCQYCKAHTTFGALKNGVVPKKVSLIWEYQTNPLFSDAERAALEVARNATLTPNAVTDEDFDRLKQHFDEEQIVEIVGVISLFGFLNRWNSTFRTDIEDAPLQVFEQHKN